MIASFPTFAVLLDVGPARGRKWHYVKPQSPPGGPDDCELSHLRGPARRGV